MSRRLLPTFAWIVLATGCGQEPVPVPVEEESEDEMAAPADVPEVKSMVEPHKREPEYRGKPLSYWVAESKSRSAASRRAAADALGNVGPAAVGALTELLQDDDMGVRLAAATALKKVRAAGK
jgi:hypothetical protein